MRRACEGSERLRALADVIAAAMLSATLETEAYATLDNEATGSLVSSLPCLGF